MQKTKDFFKKIIDVVIWFFVIFKKYWDKKYRDIIILSILIFLLFFLLFLYIISIISNFIQLINFFDSLVYINFFVLLFLFPFFNIVFYIIYKWNIWKKILAIVALLLNFIIIILCFVQNDIISWFLLPFSFLIWFMFNSEYIEYLFYWIIWCDIWFYKKKIWWYIEKTIVLLINKVLIVIKGFLIILFWYIIYRNFDTLKVFSLDALSKVFNNIYSDLYFYIYLLLLISFIILKDLNRTISILKNFIRNSFWIFTSMVLFLNLNPIFGIESYIIQYIYIYLLSYGIIIYIISLFNPWLKEKYNNIKKIYNIYDNYLFNYREKTFDEYLSENFENLTNNNNPQKNYNVQPDNPINGSITNDLLNRIWIIDKLNAVVSKVAGWKLSGAYTIGLIWWWWDGKTSVLNLLEHQHLMYKRDFKILKFNPWDYDKKNLINKFFEELAIVTDCDIKSELNTYLEKISNINSNFKPLSLFIQPLTLEKAKNKLNQKLKSLGKKIVVIIDDLDRCSPDEIVLMLNIVKNLGDLSNIIYILSYDKIHIEQSLEQKDFDKGYLEKIVNYELFLNNPTTEDKEGFITANLKEIFNWNINNKNIWEINNVAYYDQIKEVWNIVWILRYENMRFLKILFNRLYINIDNSKKYEIKTILDIIVVNYIKIKNLDFFTNR